MPLIAAAGGLLGVLGALLSEVLSGDPFLPFIAAPAAEEVMKPVGVILLMYTRPRLLGGRMHVATLCMLGGVVFGYVESAAYVYIYADRPTDGYVVFRYTVTPALHAFTSFVFGLGLNQKLIAWANGRARFRETGWRWFLAAMLLHSAYNVTVTALDSTGAFRFEQEG